MTIDSYNHLTGGRASSRYLARSYVSEGHQKGIGLRELEIEVWWMLNQIRFPF